MVKSFISACVAAAVATWALAPSPAEAQTLRDLSITIGPKGIEVGVDRHRRDRAGDYRQRCLDRNEFRRVVSFQGWHGPHQLRERRGRISLRAHQWGGLYELEFDDCSGQLLEARRMDFDRDYWDRRRSGRR